MIVKSDIVTALFFSTVENNQVVYVPDVTHDELTCGTTISTVIHVGIWIFWLMVLFGCCLSLCCRSLSVRLHLCFYSTLDFAPHVFFKRRLF